MIKTIPCYFLPSRVILIDDDEKILKNILPCLDRHTASYQTFQNPFKALDHINTTQQPLLFSQQLIEPAGSDSWQHVRLNFNIYDLYKEIYNPCRFNQISTVIVDYHMPGLNGLECCMKINNPAIQRILLTGDEDEHIAIDAFNQGIIQAYIKKHDLQVIDKLRKAITEAQLAYFQKVSDFITKAATFDPSTTALTDPTFISFFFELIKTHQLVEYYLHEITGTFLFLNNQGKVSSLFTFLQDQCDVMASFHEDKDPLFEELRTYKKILCFHSQKTTEIPHPSTWHSYVRPAQLLQGNQPYYYAYANQGFDVDTRKILSFQAYAQQHKDKDISKLQACA